MVRSSDVDSGSGSRATDAGDEIRRPAGAPAPEGGPSASEREQRLVKVTRVIWFVTGILESAIGLRVLLKLMAANPDAGFAQFVYGVTAVFLMPFFGLLATPSAAGAVLELPSIFAMVVYALIAWGIVRAMWLIFSK